MYGVREMGPRTNACMTLEWVKLTLRFLLWLSVMILIGGIGIALY